MNIVAEIPKPPMDPRTAVTAILNNVDFEPAPDLRTSTRTSTRRVV